MTTRIDMLMRGDEVADTVTKAYFVSQGTDGGGSRYTDGTINVVCEGDTLQEVWHDFKSNRRSVITRTSDGACYYVGPGKSGGRWISDEGEEI